MAYLFLNDNDYDLTEVGSNDLVDENLETGLLKLLVLGLQGNPLKTIPENTFSPIANCSLHFLNLGSCHLELIHKGMEFKLKSKPSDRVLTIGGAGCISNYLQMPSCLFKI